MKSVPRQSGPGRQFKGVRKGLRSVETDEVEASLPELEEEIAPVEKIGRSDVDRFVIPAVAVERKAAAPQQAFGLASAGTGAAVDEKIDEGIAFATGKFAERDLPFEKPQKLSVEFGGFEATAEGLGTDTIIEELLQTTPEPKAEIRGTP